MNHFFIQSIRKFVFLIFLCFFVGYTNAFDYNNYGFMGGYLNGRNAFKPSSATIYLPKGVVVELPTNWVALSKDQLIQLNGINNYTNNVNFAANYYDDNRHVAGIFNIRYYPDITITQSDAQAASEQDIEELDNMLHQDIKQGIQLNRLQLLDWLGTTKQSINGATAFVTEYRRSSPQMKSFRVHLVRFFNANRTFTITISYREDSLDSLNSLSHTIIHSIRIR